MTIYAKNDIVFNINFSSIKFGRKFGRKLNIKTWFIDGSLIPLFRVLGFSRGDFNFKFTGTRVKNYGRYVPRFLDIWTYVLVTVGPKTKIVML